MSKLRVLVSGASVAGPALAYWLVRAGCEVTIVERAASLRTSGQGIDIRDTARDVVKRMGIFDRIREKSSHEEGLEIINKDNRCLARFGVDTSGRGEGPTSDVEILRGDLAKILFDVTKDDVHYIFGDMVESLEETEQEVRVNFANGTPTTAFDLVVAADGISSKIRAMTFGNDESQTRSLNAYVSYFSIPLGNADSRWGRVCWVEGGRSMVLRPDNVGLTRAILNLVAYEKSDERLLQFERAYKEGVPAQKAALQNLFQDAGWEGPRILEGMRDSDDFYMQQVAQIRLDRWSKGRVTVVGDAGFAPSPFTGMGTSIAFIGAYILAGEISRRPDDIPAALESYERVLRPLVESIQKLPPGIPWIVNPQSKLGLRVFETMVKVVGTLWATGIISLISSFAAYLPFGGNSFQLPDYEAFRQ